MPPARKSQRSCEKGHNYVKSSDCPVCPVCEAERKPAAEFMSQLAAPARRALESKGIRSLQELSMYTEHDLLQLHGFGPSSLPILRSLLSVENLSFRTTT